MGFFDGFKMNKSRLHILSTSALGEVWSSSIEEEESLSQNITFSQKIISAVRTSIIVHCILYTRSFGGYKNCQILWTTSSKNHTHPYVMKCAFGL